MGCDGVLVNKERKEKKLRKDVLKVLNKGPRPQLGPQNFDFEGLQNRNMIPIEAASASFYLNCPQWQ